MHHHLMQTLPVQVTPIEMGYCLLRGVLVQGCFVCVCTQAFTHIRQPQTCSSTTEAMSPEQMFFHQKQHTHRRKSYPLFSSILLSIFFFIKMDQYRSMDVKRVMLYLIFINRWGLGRGGQHNNGSRGRQLVPGNSRTQKSQNARCSKRMVMNTSVHIFSHTWHPLHIIIDCTERACRKTLVDASHGHRMLEKEMRHRLPSFNFSHS